MKNNNRVSALVVATMAGASLQHGAYALEAVADGKIISPFVKNNTFVPTCTATQYLATDNGTFACRDMPQCGTNQHLTSTNGQLTCADPLIPSKMIIETETAELCQIGGQHVVTSVCPTGQQLLACSGGPGDLLESYEYWVLIPDYRNRTCTGYIGQPVCNTSIPWSKTYVNAHCYDPERTTDDGQPDPTPVVASPTTPPWEPPVSEPGDGGGGADAGDGGDAGAGDSDGDGDGSDGGDGDGGDGDGGGGDGGGGDGGGGDGG